MGGFKKIIYGILGSAGQVCFCDLGDVIAQQSTRRESRCMTKKVLNWRGEF